MDIENEATGVVDSGAASTVIEGELGGGTTVSGVETKSKESLNGSDGGVEPVETWQPSYKYKVKDSEYDMDAWAKPLIKDSELEKHLKALYAKGHGIEDIKTERQELREKYTNLESDHTSLRESLKELASFVDKGDFDSFLKMAGISEQAVLKWVTDKINYQEMPPDQRQILDAKRQSDERAYQLEYQNKYLQQEYEHRALSQKKLELDMAMNDQSVAQISKAFDERIGRQGAFRDEVIRRGDYYYRVYNKDIPAKQAVDEVIALLGTSNMSQPPQPQANGVVGASGLAKPVLPNVQASSASPIKKQPNSIDDLKKIRQNLMAQNT